MLTLTWALRHETGTLLVAALTLVLTIVLYIIVPKGFFPAQDTGVIQGISEALNKCNGATLRRANTKLFLSAPPQFAK